MKMRFSDRKQTEEIYHDRLHREHIVQRGHLQAGDRTHFKFFYSLIGDINGRKILEVGCSNGWLSMRLAESGAKVYGIDISGELVDEAIRESVKQNFSESTVFRKMAVEDLNFEDAFFDLVIGSAILHHTDIRIAIRNIFRVLKQKGRAIFVEPLNENVALRIWRKLTPWRRSPTERALLQSDLDFIRLIFPHAKYHYFGFTSIMSMGLLMFFPKSRVLHFINELLERLDALISRRFLFLGRYYAVTVLELKKAGK